MFGSLRKGDGMGQKGGEFDLHCTGITAECLNESAVHQTYKV